jgi:hypothetical protein
MAGGSELDRLPSADAAVVLCDWSSSMFKRRMFSGSRRYFRSTLDVP